jgi:glycosyltransferase involved in cell wall biosynthesis
MISGRIRYEAQDGFTAIQPPVTLPINWMPRGRVYDFFQQVNNKVVLRTIRKVLRQQEISQFIYINCYDPYYAGYLPASFGAALCVYHCIDDITQNAYSNKHGTDLENEAIRHADITLATSSKLVRMKTQLSDRVVPFFNAADVSLFRQAFASALPKPPEIEHISGKIIGFTGNLDELRIDYALLKKVAEAFPEHHLVLVGPVNSTEPAAIGLDRLPNVLFTGSRPLEALPALLRYMDCVLIPFRRNTLTQSIYPLKINEYLAAGKPVVSTSFSDDIRGFADCIYLADDDETFIRQIRSAILASNPELALQRIGIAEKNTWPARIEQFWRVVNSKLKHSNQ